MEKKKYLLTEVMDSEGFLLRKDGSLSNYTPKTIEAFLSLGWIEEAPQLRKLKNDRH
jgi:hypothetical protein